MRTANRESPFAIDPAIARDPDLLPFRDQGRRYRGAKWIHTGRDSANITLDCTLLWTVPALRAYAPSLKVPKYWLPRVPSADSM